MTTTDLIIEMTTTDLIIETKHPECVLSWAWRWKVWRSGRKVRLVHIALFGPPEEKVE